MKTMIMVRHGWAGEQTAFKRDGLKKGILMHDDLRPLDKRGRKETRQTAKGLRFLLKPTGVILSSPLIRARQTAEIIRKALKAKDDVKIVEIPELRPETPPRETWRALQKFKSHDQIVVVGHEPHFSKFLSLVLTGDTLHPLPFKKGGVAAVEFLAPERTTAKDSWKKNTAKGELRCFIQPTHTKKIRKS